MTLNHHVYQYVQSLQSPRSEKIVSMRGNNYLLDMLGL